MFEAIIMGYVCAFVGFVFGWMAKTIVANYNPRNKPANEVKNKEQIDYLENNY